MTSNRTLALAALALTAAAAPCAGAAGTASLPWQGESRGESQEAAEELRGEALFFAAFYQETALRDFERASELYAQFVEREADSSPQDLLVRALGGRARSLTALGRHEEAHATWHRVQELAPDDEEAKEAIAKAGEKPASAQVDDELRQLVFALKHDANAHRSLALYGVRAIPALIDGLMVHDTSIANASFMLLTEQIDRPETLLALEQVTPRLPERAKNQLIQYVETQVVTRPATYDLWRALYDNANPQQRHALATRLWRAVWFGEGIQGLSEQDDARLLELMERTTRDSSFIVRNRVLEMATRVWSSPQITPRRAALLNDLITRSLASVNADELEAGRRAAVHSKEVFAANFEEQLSYALGKFFVEPGRERAAWLQLALSEDWFSADQVLALLGREEVDVRALAWQWLVQGPDGLRVPKARLEPYAFDAAEDWVRARKMQKDLLQTPFEESFASFELDEQQRAKTWLRMIRHGADEGPPRSGWNAHSEEQIRIAFSGKSEAESERIAAIYHALTDDSAVHLRLAKDLQKVQPLPRTFALWNDLADEPDSAARSFAYSACVWLRSEGQDVRGRFRFPYLFDDVLDRQMRLDRMFAKVDDPALHADFDKRIEEIPPGEDRARVLGLMASKRGPEGLAVCHARLSSSGEELRYHTDLFFRAIPVEFWDDPQNRASALDLARSEPLALSSLAMQEVAESWPFEDATRLIRLALSSDGLGTSALNAALGVVVRRELGIGLEEILPFVRHVSPSIRNQADAAVERIRRTLEVRRLIESFGEDAHGRTIAAIQANAAQADPVRRRAAALGIAALGDPNGLALLFELLDDEDERVRAAAVSAFERLGGAEGAAGTTGQDG